MLVAFGLFVFVVILHGLTLLTRRQGPTREPTFLRLQFNVGNVLPTAIEQGNIWRWYALAHAIIENPGGPAERIHKVWTLYLLFDKPVAIRQFRIDASGAILPRHEVKDWSQRHAIIAFDGDLGGFVLNVQAELLPT